MGDEKDVDVGAAHPDQKTALITGACGGIGLALVRVFNDAGYKVIATDMEENPVGLPENVNYVTADLARFAADQAYAKQVVDEINSVLDFTTMNVLVNNAAIQIIGGTDSLCRSDWQTTLNVNLLAPFLLSQAFLTKLEIAKGCIINIGSIHARLTKKNFVAYATSKAALAGMTRAMSVDLGSRVRINAIEPAAVETEMLKAGFDGKLEHYELLKKCHPQCRLGQPDEVAQLSLIIAEGRFNFLHGACIGLDGGIGNKLMDPL